MFDESSRMILGCESRLSPESEGRSAGSSIFPHMGNIEKPGLHRGSKSVAVQMEENDVGDEVSEEDAKGLFFPLSPSRELMSSIYDF